MDQEWKPLWVSLPKPTSNVGIYQTSVDRLLIFGGWSHGKRNDIYILKEVQSGFTLNKIKAVMEESDTFLVNGVSRSEVGERVWIAGQEFVHEINEKTGNITVVREIRKI